MVCTTVATWLGERIDTRIETRRSPTLDRNKCTAANKQVITGNRIHIAEKQPEGHLQTPHARSENADVFSALSKDIYRRHTLVQKMLVCFLRSQRTFTDAARSF